MIMDSRENRESDKLEYGFSTEPVPGQEENPSADEQNSGAGNFDALDIESSRAKKKRKRRKNMLVQVAAAMIAVVIVKDSFGIDMLKTSPVQPGPPGTSDPGSYTQPAEHTDPFENPGILPEDQQQTEQPPDDGSLDHADLAFPALTNLEPNGPVEPYGSLNEEFVIIEDIPDLSGNVSLWLGDAYGHYDENNVWVKSAFYPDDLKNFGAVYDRGSNTLYLDDYKIGGGLNINWMGNGFKLVVHGDCHLDYIIAWGFMWGGSITITGDGKLTVGENRTKAVGILFEAENSASCLMIDSGVELDVIGKGNAILIRQTTMEKAIYYLEPLTLSAGMRSSIADPESEGSYYCDIADENGVSLTHVTFSRPEDN